MSDKYKLEGKRAVPVADLMEWARWFETAERHVAHDEIGPFRISTVFLGLDHRHFSEGEPLLFETMIFGPDDSELEGWQDRCSTWEQAEAMHGIATALVRAALN
jgi:hypothetical protein